MKKVLILLFILVLGCNKTEEANEYHLSVAIDITEGKQTKLSDDLVLSFIKDYRLSDGISLSIIPIADTPYTSTSRFLLNKGEVGWLANEDLRRKQRKILFKRFNDSIVKFNSSNLELKRSEIYRTICKELNYLATKSGKRQLIISSDLKEHSSVFSVYDPKQFRLFLGNPNKTATIFESSVELASDLSGITIYMIYIPTFEESDTYLKMIELYKFLLEPRGARVVIGSQNTITI